MGSWLTTVGYGITMFFTAAAFGYLVNRRRAATGAAAEALAA